MASPPFRSRRIVVACGLVVAFMLVIVRLVNLQVMQSAELTVKAGKKVRLTFVNRDFMPHNILLVKPGTDNAVATKAIELGAKGFEVGFIPKTDDILWASKLIDGGKEDVVEFTAPEKTGDYPYICSFPGHHLIMRGVLHVK